jgi:hypothetical protein
MKVICKHNAPDNTPSHIPNNFDFGLELGKEYLVMGLLTFKLSNDLYFLIDEGGRPSWFPNQIFKVVSNDLPHNWFVRINVGNDYVDYQNLIGFDELCNEEGFFEQLLERHDYAMRTYFRRKIELENELAGD